MTSVGRTRVRPHGSATHALPPASLKVASPAVRSADPRLFESNIGSRRIGDTTSMTYPSYGVRIRLALGFLAPP